MEYMGLGALLALWRYFFDIDWDFRVRRRKRPQETGPSLKSFTRRSPARVRAAADRSAVVVAAR
jgi:hypothetical protein